LCSIAFWAAELNDRVVKGRLLAIVNYFFPNPFSMVKSNTPLT
jgi:hypothetical protein